MRLREIASTPPSWSTHRLHVLLRREGWLINHTRTERFYRIEGLSVSARWSMDFMHYQLEDGRKISVLTVVDQYTRKPLVIQVDNGTEFASRALDAWASREDVRLDFSRSGKPADNAYVESFNARLRAECLNAHSFELLDDADKTLTSWRRDSNAVRPQSALGMLTPTEFAELGQRSADR